MNNKAPWLPLNKTQVVLENFFSDPKLANKTNSKYLNKLSFILYSY